MLKSKVQKTVCLITPNHIATNPRLVKEAIALESAGYRVHLLFTQESNYSAGLDNQLLRDNPNWKHTKLNWTGSTSRSKVVRVWFGLVQKMAGKLAGFRLSPGACYRVVNRNFYWQLHQAKKIDAQLFIAHNLGALPVAVLAAKWRGTAAGFDAEDFHRHEASDDVNELGVRIKATVEKVCLLGIRHFTAASPMIAEAYHQLFPNLSASVVLNVFPKPASSCAEREKHRPLHLYWFSQTVGANRGLQDVFRAMRRLQDYQLVFDIYGVVPQAVRGQFDDLLEKLSFFSPPAISFKGTVPPDELMAVTSCYDVGLAIEPGFSGNNRMALSNKIFTYLCGGNAIVFSSTPAQQSFFKMHPNIGLLYDAGDDAGLASQLLNYLQNRSLLDEHKQNSRDLFKRRMNWDHEQQIFLGCVGKIL